jgi:uncharacterized protein YpiB (UPF0302 family)
MPDQKIFHNVPVFYYKEMRLIDDKEQIEGDRLIEKHCDECDLVVQFHNAETSEKQIAEIIHHTRKLKLIPLYIHVYPAQESTITVYAKHNLFTNPKTQ